MDVLWEYKNAPQVKSLFKKGMKRGFTAEQGMFIVLFRWGIANPPPKQSKDKNRIILIRHSKL